MYCGDGALGCGGRDVVHKVLFWRRCCIEDKHLAAVKSDGFKWSFYRLCKEIMLA
jgi:hypothetical protein